MNHNISGHSFVPVSVRRMVRVRYLNPLWGREGLVGQPEPVTLVLLRCDCGQVDTKELAGDWTLEEVRGGR